MKKWVYIIGGSLLLIGVGFVIFQWDNLIAIIDSRRYDSEELALIVEERKEELEEALKAVLPQPVLDLTLEDEAALLAGKMTEAEAIAKIKIPTENDENTEAAAIENLIAQYVGELYGLKATYLGRLGALLDQAEEEFNRLPEAERTGAAKTVIISKYTARAASLESQCDGQVERVLDTLQSSLIALGGDTSIVDILRSSYEEEKAAKKAYFLSLI